MAMGLLWAAAWHDLRTRLIPDSFCLILAVSGAVYRGHFGLIDFAFSAIMSLLLFFLLFAAFNRGVVGGGDVKLLVATGLWLSPPDCYVFLVVTALAGGVLAMLHLVLRRVIPKGRTRGVQGVQASDLAGVEAPSVDVSPSDGAPARGVLRAELARIRRGEPMPYGVAIAVGGCYALLLSLGG